MLDRCSALVRTPHQTLVCLVLAVSSLANTQSAQAQIMLRGETQRPVSTVTPNSSVASLSNREYEFEQLQQEASVLERHLGLIRRIVKLAAPSVVHIEASKRSEAGNGLASSRVDEAGAGVIVHMRGQLFVLTNRHVIHPADTSGIRIELTDGRQLRPMKIWADPSTDVGVMQIDGTDLVPARLGNSDEMEIGDYVLAVGSPFGLSHSVTHGILSAKGRRNLELGSRDIEIQDFFQTDAAINPGNSGGPLLNMRGEIIGINTAIASNSGGNEGIGFTIPINMAMLVADQLVTRGRLQRSYLGVVLENSFSGAMAHRLGLPSNEGALIKSVLPSSPAEKAGLRVGDVVLEFDGSRIENDGHLVKTVSLTRLGKQVDVVVFRNQTRQKVSLTLEPSPES